MIYGFNTEIEHGGHIFHIQTSDKGRRNPIIETLIYRGGEVRDTRRTNYADLIKRGYDEKKVIKLMEAQHRRVIYAIKKGALDEAEAEPAATVEQELLEAAESEGKDLDDMILQYLSAQPETEKLELVVATRSRFEAGKAVFMRLLASTSVTRRPVEGAQVTVELQDRGALETLYEGTTDEEGEAVVMFIVPPVEPSEAQLVVRADSALGRDEVSQQISASA